MRSFQDCLHTLDAEVLHDWLFLFASDTVYGLGCVLGNAEALDRLYELKERPKVQPMQLLVCDRAMAEKWAKINKDQPLDASSRLYFASDEAKSSLDSRLIKDAKVSIRLPAHEGLLALIAQIGAPIVGSSANHRGKPPCASEAEARANFPEVAVVLGGDAYLGQASEIWDMTLEPIKQLR